MPPNNRKYNTFEEYWKVENCGYVTPCWRWVGIIADNGYGKYWLSCKQFLAHRFVYSKYKNIEIPKNKQLDHLCNNKFCVNPEHLTITTPAQNVRRAFQKFTQQELIEIRTSKEFSRVIAERYGVCRKTIDNIKKGKTWNPDVV